MNTPAHAVFNMWILGRRGRPLWPYALGGILPDLPIVFFYLWERVIRGVPEMTIWRDLYFEPRWQHLFDGFHSLPLLLLVWLAARALRSVPGQALALSMGLHALADVPLHNADAHRPLWPLSSWRFVSPVSYWDPRHFGGVFVVAELAIVLGGSVVLWRRFPATAPRALVALVAGSHILFLALALMTWM